MLQSLSLRFVKIKAPNNAGSFAFVTFVDEAAREEALGKLNGHKYKGKQLEAIVIDQFYCVSSAFWILLVKTQNPAGVA